MSEMFVDPGALNHRLTLERIVETPDGCGGVAVSWSPVATIWARLRPASAKSELDAQQTAEVSAHQITIRYRDDIASGWRFTGESRVFAILTVSDPNERARYLVCNVEEEGR